MASAVVSAAVDDDQAQGWIDVVEDPDTTMDLLSNRGKEPSLDSKLRTALLKNSQGDAYIKHQDLMDTIAREARRIKKKFAEQGIDRTIRGRQILWMIRDFHGVDAGKRVMFNIKALADYAWSGDANLVRWKLHWDFMVENQKTPLDDDQLMPIFLEKIAHSAVLKNYVDYFNRVEKGDAEHTYKWLSKKVDKYIKDNRERLNQENLNSGGNLPPKKAAAVTTTEETPASRRATKKAAAAAKKAEAAVAAAAYTNTPGGGRGAGGKDKGKGKGKDKGKGKGKDNPNAPKKGFAADGTPLRCVWHWFGKCKSHPLKPGDTCRFGPHVPEPSKSEKERPAFKKCEELHGAWEPGKFKYPTAAAAAAKKAEMVETPPTTPR